MISRVFYCGNTNSTLFTTCCKVAILDDELCCSRCKKPVPYTPRQRHDMAMRDLYGSARVDEMRKEWAQKERRALEAIARQRALLGEEGE